MRTEQNNSKPTLVHSIINKAFPKHLCSLLLYVLSLTPDDDDDDNNLWLLTQQNVD